MPIPVTCQCGKSFAAKETLAGKAVPCPNCGQTLEIPAPESKSLLADLLEEAGVQDVKLGAHRCPNCKTELPASAVLCVKCGYHLELEKTLRQRRDPPTQQATVADYYSAPSVDTTRAGSRTRKHVESAARSSSQDRELSTLEYVICAWPLVLLILGGAIGGAMGGAAAFINVSIFKTNIPLFLKLFLIVLCGMAAFFGWIVVAVAVHLMLNK